MYIYCEHTDAYFQYSEVDNNTVKYQYRWL